jgi:hypothetical protein
MVMDSTRECPSGALPSGGRCFAPRGNPWVAHGSLASHRQGGARWMGQITLGVVARVAPLWGRSLMGSVEAKDRRIRLTGWTPCLD